MITLLKGIFDAIIAIIDFIKFLIQGVFSAVEIIPEILSYMINCLNFLPAALTSILVLGLSFLIFRFIRNLL